MRGALSYVRYGTPNQVFVYPLRPEWQPWNPSMRLSGRQLVALRQAFHAVPDRFGGRDRRYPLATVLAARLVSCQKPIQPADLGRALSQDVLHHICSCLRTQSQRYHVREPSTLHYVLKEVDVDVAERIKQLPSTARLFAENTTSRRRASRAWTPPPTSSPPSPSAPA